MPVLLVGLFALYLGENPAVRVRSEPAMASQAVATELSVGDISISSGETSAIIVSGIIDGDTTFGITIIAEIIPRAGNSGTVVFTPAPPVDITQAGDPWPGAGMFDPFDTNEPAASVTLNASFDDNGTFLSAALTYSGPLTLFPIVAGSDASGVWDVVLSTSQGPSIWQGATTTTLTSGTITVSPASCIESSDCGPGQRCDPLNHVCVPSVPTVSQWGLAVMTLVLFAVGTIRIRTAI